MNEYAKALYGYLKSRPDLNIDMDENAFSQKILDKSYRDGLYGYLGSIEDLNIDMTPEQFEYNLVGSPEKVKPRDAKSPSTLVTAPIGIGSGMHGSWISGIVAPEVQRMGKKIMFDLGELWEKDISFSDKVTAMKALGFKGLVRSMQGVAQLFYKGIPEAIDVVKGDKSVNEAIKEYAKHSSEADKLMDVWSSVYTGSNYAVQKELEEKSFLFGTLPSAFGQVAGTVLPGLGIAKVGGKAAGLLTSGLIGIGMESSEMLGEAYDENMATEHYWKVALMSIPIGMVEALGNPSQVSRMLAKTVKEGGLRALGKRLAVDWWKFGAPEAMEEFIQTVGENFTAKQWYDFQRGYMDGTLESTIAGFIPGGAMGLAFSRINRGEQKQQLETNKKLMIAEGTITPQAKLVEYEDGSMKIEDVEVESKDDFKKVEDRIKKKNPKASEVEVKNQAFAEYHNTKQVEKRLTLISNQANEVSRGIAEDLNVLVQQEKGQVEPSGNVVQDILRSGAASLEKSLSEENKTLIPGWIDDANELSMVAKSLEDALVKTEEYKKVEEQLTIPEEISPDVRAKLLNAKKDYILNRMLNGNQNVEGLPEWNSIEIGMPAKLDVDLSGAVESELSKYWSSEVAQQTEQKIEKVDAKQIQKMSERALGEREQELVKINKEQGINKPLYYVDIKENVPATLFRGLSGEIRSAVEGVDFYTASPSIARQYSQRMLDRNTFIESEGSVINYMEGANPRVMEVSYIPKKILDTTKELPQDVKNELIKNGYDRLVRLIEERMEGIGTLDLSAIERDSKFFDIIRKLGYDTVKFRDYTEVGVDNSYAILYPERVETQKEYDTLMKIEPEQVVGTKAWIQSIEEQIRISNPEALTTLQKESEGLTDEQYAEKLEKWADEHGIDVYFQREKPKTTFRIHGANVIPFKDARMFDVTSAFDKWLDKQTGRINLSNPLQHGIKGFGAELIEQFRQEYLAKNNFTSIPKDRIADFKKDWNNWLKENFGLRHKEGIYDEKFKGELRYSKSNTPYGFDEISNEENIKTVAGNEVVISGNFSLKDLPHKYVTEKQPEATANWESISSPTTEAGLGWYIYSEINGQPFIYEWQSDMLPELFGKSVSSTTKSKDAEGETVETEILTSGEIRVTNKNGTKYYKGYLYSNVHKFPEHSSPGNYVPVQLENGKWVAEWRDAPVEYANKEFNDKLREGFDTPQELRAFLGSRTPKMSTSAMLGGYGATDPGAIYYFFTKEEFENFKKEHPEVDFHTTHEYDKEITKQEFEAKKEELSKQGISETLKKFTSKKIDSWEELNKVVEESEIDNTSAIPTLENLWKRYWTTWLMHSFMYAKQKGHNIVWLPTGEAMYEIEGSERTAAMYATKWDISKELPKNISFNTTVDNGVDATFRKEGDNYFIEYDGSNGEKSISKAEFEDAYDSQFATKFDKVGVYWTALNKIKGIKLELAQPEWSIVPLIKADISEVETDAIVLFQQIKELDTERFKAELSRPGEKVIDYESRTSGRRERRIRNVEFHKNPEYFKAEQYNEDSKQWEEREFRLSRLASVQGMEVEPVVEEQGEVKNKQQLFTQEKMMNQLSFRGKPIKLGYIAEGVALRNTPEAILVDLELLQLKFNDKAWTKPRVEGVKAYPENEFTSFDEFLTFALIHEIQHDILKKGENESRADYENRVNEAAYNELNEKYVRKPLEARRGTIVKTPIQSMPVGVKVPQKSPNAKIEGFTKLGQIVKALSQESKLTPAWLKMLEFMAKRGYAVEWVNRDFVPPGTVEPLGNHPGAFAYVNTMKQGKIYLNKDVLVDLKDITHEMVHNFTVRAYKEDKVFRIEVDELYDDFRAKLDDSNIEMTDALRYGLSTPLEFLAEGLTPGTDTYNALINTPFDTSEVNRFKKPSDYLIALFDRVINLWNRVFGKDAVTYMDALRTILQERLRLPLTFEFDISPDLMRDDAKLDDEISIDFDRLIGLGLSADTKMNAKVVKSLMELLHIEGVPTEWIRSHSFDSFRNQILDNEDIKRALKLYYVRLEEEARAFYPTPKDFMDAMIRSFYNRAISLTKRTTANVDLTFNGQTGNIDIKVVPLGMNYIDKSGNTQMSYESMILLDELLPEVNKILGSDLKLIKINEVSFNTFQKMYFNPAEKRIEIVPTERGFRAYLKMGTDNQTFEDLLLKQGYYYLQNHSDKKSIYMVKGSNPIDFTNAIKRWQEAIGELGEMTPSQMLTLLIKDVKMGGTAEKSAFDPTTKIVELLKRGNTEIIPKNFFYVNNEIFQNALSKSNNKQAWSFKDGTLTFRAVVFDDSQDLQMGELNIPMKVSNGKPIFDGDTMTLLGDFGNVWKYITGSTKSGAMKFAVLNRGIYGKGMGHTVSPGSFLGSLFTDNKIAMIIPLSVAKYIVGQNYKVATTLNEIQDSIFELSINDLQKNYDDGIHKDTHGFQQAFTATSMEYTKIAEKVIERLVQNFDREVSNLTPAVLLDYIKTLAIEGTDQKTRSIARILTDLFTPWDMKVFESKNEGEKIDTKAIANKLKANEKIAEGVVNILAHPYFRDMYFSLLNKKLENAIKIGIPGGAATNTPDLGILDENRIKIAQGQLRSIYKYDDEYVKLEDKKRVLTEQLDKMEEDNPLAPEYLKQLEDLTEQESKLIDKIQKGFENVFDENGFLKKDWGFVSGDIAKKRGLKVGDWAIAVRVPTDGIKAIAVFRVAGILDDSTIEANSLVLNNELVQVTIGGDYDGDTLKLISYSPYFGTRADYKQLVEDIQRQTKEYDEKCINAIKRAFKKAKVSKVAGKSIYDLTEEDFYNQEIRIAFIQTLFPSTDFDEENMKAFDKQVHYDVQNAFYSEIGLPVQARKWKVLLGLMNFTTGIIDANHSGSNVVEAMLRILTHFFVDAPKDTGKFHFKYDHDNAMQFTLTGEMFDAMDKAQQAEWAGYNRLINFLFGKAMKIIQMKEEGTLDDADFFTNADNIIAQREINKALLNGDVQTLKNMYKEYYNRNKFKDGINIDELLEGIDFKKLDVNNHPIMKIINELPLNKIPLIPNINAQQSYTVDSSTFVDLAQKIYNKQFKHYVEAVHFALNDLTQEQRDLRDAIVNIINPNFTPVASEKVLSEVYPQLVEEMFKNTRVYEYRQSMNSVTEITLKDSQGKIKFFQYDGGIAIQFDDEIGTKKAMLATVLHMRPQAERVYKLFESVDNIKNFQRLAGIGSKNLSTESRWKVANKYLLDLGKLSDEVQRKIYLSLLTIPFDLTKYDNNIIPVSPSKSNRGANNIHTKDGFKIIAQSMYQTKTAERSNAYVLEAIGKVQSKASNNFMKEYITSYSDNVETKVPTPEQKYAIALLEVAEPGDVEVFFASERQYSEVIRSKKPILGLTTAMEYVSKMLAKYPIQNLDNVINLHIPVDLTEGADIRKVSEALVQGVRAYDIKDKMSLYSVLVARLQALSNSVNEITSLNSQTFRRVNKSFNIAVTSEIESLKSQERAESYKETVLETVKRRLRNISRDKRVRQRVWEDINSLVMTGRIDPNQSFESQTFTDVEGTQIVNKDKFKAAYELSRMYNVDNTRIISNIIQYLNIVSIIGQGGQNYRLILDAITKRYEKLLAQMRGMEYKYIPRYYSDENLLAMLKQIDNGAIESKIKATIEQETAKRDEGKPYNEAYVDISPKKLKKMVEDNLISEYTALKVDRTAGAKSGLMFKRNVPDDIAQEYMITDSGHIHNLHQQMFQKMIEKDLGLLYALEFDYEATKAGYSYEDRMRVRLFSGVNMVQNILLKSDVIKMNEIKPKDSIAFYVTMRKWGKSEVERKIEGTIDRVDDNNIYIRVDSRSVEEYINRKIQESERIAREQRRNYRALTIGQKTTIIGLVEEGYLDEPTVPLNMMTAALGSELIAQGMRAKLEDKANWGKFRKEDIYTKRDEGDEVRYYKGVDKYYSKDFVELENFLVGFSSGTLLALFGGVKNKFDANFGLNREIGIRQYYRDRKGFEGSIAGLFPWTYGKGVSSKREANKIAMRLESAEDLMDYKAVIKALLPQGEDSLNESELSNEDTMKLVEAVSLWLLSKQNLLGGEIPDLTGVTSKEGAKIAGKLKGAYGEAVDIMLKNFKDAEIYIRHDATYLFTYRAIKLEGLRDLDEIAIAVRQGIERTQGLYSDMYRALAIGKPLGRWLTNLSQFNVSMRSNVRTEFEALIEQKGDQSWYEYLWKNRVGARKTYLSQKGKRKGQPRGAFSLVEPDMAKKVAYQFFLETYMASLQLVMPGLRMGNPIYRATVQAGLMVYLLANALFNDGDEPDKGEWDNLIFSLVSIWAGIGFALGIQVPYNLIASDKKGFERVTDAVVGTYMYSRVANTGKLIYRGIENVFMDSSPEDPFDKWAYQWTKQAVKLGFGGVLDPVPSIAKYSAVDKDTGKPIFTQEEVRLRRLGLFALGEVVANPISYIPIANVIHWRNKVK